MAAEVGGGAVVKETLTAEEEALKRNTDCVYFLASPLTCKKGSECEYRHSEGARVNPRDCWYWLNGNCLNPKCSFRHPPLDGLYGPSGTSLPQAQIPAAHASGYNANRQSVPCYYFQKGTCLKGDRCLFMHGSQPVANSGPQINGGLTSQQTAQVLTSSTEQHQVLKSNSRAIKSCDNLHQPKMVDGKSTEVPIPSRKPVVKAETSSGKGLLHLKSSSQYLSVLELSPQPQPGVPLVHQISPLDEHVQNGRETDEFLAESSPGFDVLVDDDGEDPEYFHNEDEYGRGAGQGGTDLNLANDFDYQHSDYEPVSQFQRNRFNDGESEYDRNGRVLKRGDWEVRTTSSERVLDRSSRPVQRISLRREDNHNAFNRSDLRHRLKQRRLNNSRTAVSPDRQQETYPRGDNYAEERQRARHSSRDVRDYHLEGTISSRLIGRITLPGRTPPDNPVHRQSEREMGRRRHHSRLSPSQPISNYQERHQERTRRLLNEEPSRDAKSNSRQQIKRDEAEYLDFTGPKSLTELKGAKSADNFHEKRVKELRNMKPLKSAVGHQEPEGSVSFEGPKPLSIILKRKRETTPGTSAVSGSGDENQRKDSEGIIKAGLAATSDFKQHLSEAEDHFEEEEEDMIHSEGDEHKDGQLPSSNALETEDGMIMDAMEEYPDFEHDERRDVAYEYDVNQGGDFRTEEDDNMHPDVDEDLDDDDDFSKKVGMMIY